MAGTKAGGLKAAKKNLKKDPNFYRRIGKIGGANGTGGGFAFLSETDPDRHRRVSAKGGSISRRPKLQRT